MKNIRRIVLAKLVMISLLAISVSVSGCSMLANALKGDTNQDPPVLPVEEQEDLGLPKNSTAVEQEQTNESSPVESNSREKEQTQLNAFEQTNCREPTEADYIYGDYQVGWTARGDRYEGILQMNGDTGQMRVRFFNEGINSEDWVDQTMILANCPQGLILLGFNPRIPDTNDQHSSYSADNILMRRETNGAVTLIVVDDQGVTAPLEIQQISN